MLKKTFVLVLFCLLCLPMFIVSPAPAGAAENAPVYVITVKGEIGPSWLVYLKRSLAEAQEAGARAVILDMDTPGGYVDSALQARKLLVDFDGPVYAYVNPRALSAGAYLALVADHLYMAPGSTLGAAEPRLRGSGEVTDEKFLSSWEAEMRTAAELRERDPHLAAAMVRREIEIEGLVEEGKLLTLTAREGDRLGFSDGTAESMQALLEIAGLSGSPVVGTSPTPREQFGGWLINPVVATVILALAFLFLLAEILTAGFGVAGLLSILCFALFFGGHLFSGLSGWSAVSLFVFGVVLILVEVFIPGFGIFGIGGLVAVAVSIVLSATTAVEGLRILLYSFILSAVCGWFAFRYFQRRGTLRRFILMETATREAGYSASADLSHLASREGITVTPLRPSGMVEVDDTRYDVVSEGSFVPAGVGVKVIKVEGRRVVVCARQTMQQPPSVSQESGEHATIPVSPPDNKSKIVGADDPVRPGTD
ncbi:MAG: NfeD family protein [Bacillota bacterium]